MNRRGAGTADSQKEEKKICRDVRFLKLIKTLPMGSKATIDRTDQILNILRNATLDQNESPHAKYLINHCEDISERTGFPSAFRYVMKDLFFDFYVLNDTEAFATYGKIDTPINANVKVKNIYLDDFVIEYFTFLYFSVVDDILCVMEGSRVPNIQEAFSNLLNNASGAYEYSVACIQDTKIVERFKKAKEIKSVKIKIAAPGIEILKKRGMSYEELASVVSNQFLLTEAILTFKPNVEKFRISNSIQKFIPIFRKKTSQKDIAEMAISFCDEDLEAELIRASTNYFSKKVTVPANQRVNPKVVYETLKTAYTENRTDVRSCLLGSD